MKAQKFITEANKHQVCKLLGWSIDDYTAYQEAKGLEYLADMVDGDWWSVDIVSKCAMFWRWWVNHWNQRDEEFLAIYRDFPADFLALKYDDLNDVGGFKFWPHKVIMEHTYAIMVKEMNKELIAG